MKTLIQHIGVTLFISVLYWGGFHLTAFILTLLALNVMWTAADVYLAASHVIATKLGRAEVHNLAVQCVHVPGSGLDLKMIAAEVLTQHMADHLDQ